MTIRNRLLILLTAVAVLAAVAATSVLHAADRAARKDRPQAGGPAVISGPVALTGTGTLVFRNMAWGPHRDELATVPAATPSARRTASGVKCLRFYAASGTGICLQSVHGAVTDTYRAVVLDARLHERRHYALAGIPTRARVSPSGRMVAWTVFVSGDSYAGTNFSTRTSILDTRTWQLTSTLEDLRILKSGEARPYHAADVNFWGVTFADDTHFYATLATAGSTYLVRGDTTTRTVRTLLTNVECPSLSPDGAHLVFKKRVRGLSPDAPWRLYALDLATMRSRPLAETRSVDDQVVWRGPRTIVYALPGDYGADLWTVPADGTGTAHRLMTAALAPAYVGP
jgi:dipeptidyl aminopeptidase/acylaminoacyl peptidase